MMVWGNDTVFLPLLCPPLCRLVGGERVWGVRHGGTAWGLVMQHCGIAAGVTQLG
jgi:hypothetical protein